MLFFKANKRKENDKSFIIKEKSNVYCMDSLERELLYSDNEYYYYFNPNRYCAYYIEFNNNEYYIENAIKENIITIKDLEKYGIDIEKVKK